MENVLTQSQGFEQEARPALQRGLPQCLWRISSAAFLAAFVLLAMASGAYAQTVTQDVNACTTVLFDPINPVDIVSVAEFDPSLGILQTVDYTVTVSIDASVTFTNTADPGTGAQPINGSYRALVGATLLDGSQPIVLAIQDPGPFGGGVPITTSPLLPSEGETVQFSESGSVNGQYTGATDLALFTTGTGVVDFPFASLGEAAIRVGSNADASVATDSEACVEIRYTFLPIPNITLEKSTNGVDADSPIGPYIQIGDPVEWTYVVSNTGTVDVALDDLDVTDNVAGVTPVFDATTDAGSDSILSPSEAWTYVATDVATANQYMNIGTAEITVPGLTNPITSTDPSHYFGINPEYVVTKVADQEVVAPGTDVTYTYLVTNTGNITLTNVVVTDDLCAPVTIITGDADGALAVGEVWEYSCIATLDADTTNTATVGADDPTGPTPPITTTETVDVLPTIDVIKTADPVTVPESGGDVTFTFEVVNTSQEAVTLTSLVDSVYGDLNGQGTCATGGVIAVGASYICSIIVTLSADSASVTDLLHTNTVTAGAEDDEGNPVSGTDNAEVQIEDLLPTIDVIKTANPTAIPEAGGVVTFTFEVVNTSAEPVTLTALTDSVYGDLNGEGTCATGGLIAVGASYVCILTDTLDINSPSVVDNIHTNVVSADATDDDGNTTVPVTDDAEVLVASPKVEATKVDAIADTNGDGRNGPGDTISYTIVIDNSGLVPAEAAFLNDLADSNTVLTVGSVTTTQGNVTSGNNAGDTSIGIDIGDIAPSGSVTITFDVVIVDPLPDGVTQIANQGVVTGNNFPQEPTDDPDTPTDDDPTVTPLELLPNLLATKRDSLHDDVDGNGSPSPGDYLKYEVVIVNNGNSAATGVVFNDQPDPNTKVDCNIPVTTTAGTVDECSISLVSVNIGTMAPGAQVTIEFYVRIDNPLANAGIREVANQGLIESNELPTVPTDDPDTPENGDPTVTPITVAPVIESTKNDRLLVDVNGDGLVSPGDILIYEVIISNEGNVPVNNIVFSDTVDPNTTLITQGGDGTALILDPVQTGQGTVVTADPNGDPNIVVNVGTINPGDQVGISFRVQINNPLPAGVDSVANQGIVNGTSGDTFVEEPTDDPETPEDDDPTVTPISAPPIIEAYKSALTVGGADASGIVEEGSTMIYRITIVNSGTGPATGVFLADTLDANTALIIGSVKTERSTDIVSFGNNPGDVSVGVALDTIPGGGEVTISFEVLLGTFNRPLGAQGGCQLVNQAVITYENTSFGPTGLSTVSTDDPNTPKFDATETAVQCAPTSLTQGAEADFSNDDATGQFIFLPFVNQ